MGGLCEVGGLSEVDVNKQGACHGEGRLWTEHCETNVLIMIQPYTN